LVLPMLQIKRSRSYQISGREFYEFNLFYYLFLTK
jgi:hypothetical protein